MRNFAVEFNETPFMYTSTTGAEVNRLNWRCELLLSRNTWAVKNKRILDLGSHDGRFSYACLSLGARHVTGVEGRPQHVRNACENMRNTGFPPDSFEFIEGDIFDYLGRLKGGEFDTILCFGFLYHTVRQVELFRIMASLTPETFLVDTTVHKGFIENRVLPRLEMMTTRLSNMTRAVSKAGGPRPFPFSKSYMIFYPVPNLEREGVTICGHKTAAVPSKALLESLFDIHGFMFKKIDWRKSDIENWSHLKDYRSGRRISYIAKPAASIPV